MRHANMTRVHPQTEFAHRCARCNHVVGIFPSGQKALREMPELEIVCDVCAGDTTAVFNTGTMLPGVRQEARESLPLDPTKKNPS
jgi:hypothetical protein